MIFYLGGCPRPRERRRRDGKSGREGRQHVAGRTKAGRKQLQLCRRRRRNGIRYFIASPSSSFPLSLPLSLPFLSPACHTFFSATFSATFCPLESCSSLPIADRSSRLSSRLRPTIPFPPLLRLAMVATPHVALERGVLHEGVPADGAEVGPLARVLPEVHPQRLGQREPLAAVAALEGPLARVPPRVLPGRPPRREAPPAARRCPVRAGKGLHALVRPQVNHEVVSNSERRGALRAGCKDNTVYSQSMHTNSMY